MDGVLAGRRDLAAFAAVVFAVAVCTLWFGLRLGGTTVALWADDLITPLAAMVACASCVTARRRQDAVMRPFWSLLAAAAASWSLAELLWGYYALIRQVPVPVPSWADLGYLSAIPLTVAALIVHPAVRTTGLRTTRTIFEGLLTATALLFLSWTLVLGPLWRSTDLGTVGGIVALAYPFGDVVIVFCIVLAIRGMTGDDRRPLWCLLSALGAMALSDSTFTYLTGISDYTSPGFVDAGWVAAYLGIALAGFTARSRGVVLAHRHARSRPTLASLVAPLVPVLLALTVAGVQIRLGHHLDRAAWIMVVALIALVLLRQALALRELLAPGSDPQAGLMARLTEVVHGADPVHDGV